jgi:hypothetical protein
MLILLNKYPRSVEKWTGSPHVGLFVTPMRTHQIPAMAASGLPWAADNGCFRRFDRAGIYAMFRAVREHLGGCLFVAAPDVVGDGAETLGQFYYWLDMMADADENLSIPVALVAQDRMEELDLDYAVGLADAVFIGGTTGYKLSRAAATVAAEFRRRGKWVHMGRVNTLGRIRAAFAMGCDSIDGSGFNLFPDANMPGALAEVARLVRTARRPHFAFMKED